MTNRLICFLYASFVRENKFTYNELSNDTVFLNRYFVDKGYHVASCRTHAFQLPLERCLSNINHLTKQIKDKWLSYPHMDSHLDEIIFSELYDALFQPSLLATEYIEELLKYIKKECDYYALKKRIYPEKTILLIDRYVNAYKMSIVDRYTYFKAKETPPMEKINGVKIYE